jgi:hypothetical protein
MRLPSEYSLTAKNDPLSTEDMEHAAEKHVAMALAHTNKGIEELSKYRINTPNNDARALRTALFYSRQLSAEASHLVDTLTNMLEFHTNPPGAAAEG